MTCCTVGRSDVDCWCYYNEMAPFAYPDAELHYPHDIVEGFWRYGTMYREVCAYGACAMVKRYLVVRTGDFVCAELCRVWALLPGGCDSDSQCEGPFDELFVLDEEG